LRSLSKYIKEHYKRVYIKRELYEKLRELASREGVTVPDLIAKMYERYIQPNITPNISPNTAVSRDISPNIQHNISPNTAPSTSTSVVQESSERKRSGHVWCEKKARIRSLQGFLKWVEKTYGLIDYWEEEDRYCFETLEPPKKERGEKSKRKGPEEGEVEGEELE
jgi:hypothetical protein